MLMWDTKREGDLKGKIALPTLLVAAWTKLLGKQFLEINHNQN